MAETSIELNEVEKLLFEHVLAEAKRVEIEAKRHGEELFLDALQKVVNHRGLTNGKVSPVFKGEDLVVALKVEVEDPPEADVVVPSVE